MLFADDFDTVTIRNLPVRCQREEVIGALNQLGFSEDVLSFVYLPTRSKNAKKPCNRGYCFVGFHSPSLAQRFLDASIAFRLPGRQGAKDLVIERARIQGLAPSEVSPFGALRTPAEEMKRQQATVELACVQPEPLSIVSFLSDEETTSSSQGEVDVDCKLKVFSKPATERHVGFLDRRVSRISIAGRSSISSECSSLRRSSGMSRASFMSTSTFASTLGLTAAYSEADSNSNSSSDSEEEDETGVPPKVEDTTQAHFSLSRMAGNNVSACEKQLTVSEFASMDSLLGQCSFTRFQV
jgi:hypothetical protein